jgi:hypothetical protein
MMHRYDNLYGDTAVMASLIRWNSLAKLSRENESLRSRLIHGSDYPFPPARLPYLRRTGLFPAERNNPFDLDYRIKTSFDLGQGYCGQLLELMGVPRSHVAASA